MKKLTGPCPTCGRMGIVRMVWLMAWLHCPSCGANTFGIMKKVQNEQE